MTHQQKLEAIRRACVEPIAGIRGGHRMWREITAVGTAFGTDCVLCGMKNAYKDRRACPKGDIRTIRLADVLLAIGRREDRVHISCDGWFCVLQVPTMQFARRAQWDLRNDDLSKQSEETVDFIHGLLKGV